MELNESIIEKAKLVELKPIARSSNIAFMGYSENDKLLKVSFRTKNGHNTYLYENVEPETYDTILKSQSIGKALNELVVRQKEKYNYYKLV